MHRGIHDAKRRRRTEHSLRGARDSGRPAKAIRVEEYGGPETLRLRNVELPDPGPDEVHLKLRAAGLNFVDIYLRRGELRAAGPTFLMLTSAVANTHHLFRLRLAMMARASSMLSEMASKNSGRGTASPTLGILEPMRRRLWFRQAS